MTLIFGVEVVIFRMFDLKKIATLACFFATTAVSRQVSQRNQLLLFISSPTFEHQSFKIILFLGLRCCLRDLPAEWLK